MTALERRSSVSLALIFALRMLGLFLVLPVFALEARKYPGGDDPALVGLAMGIYGLTQAALQLPLGIASDRFGRKRVIVLGLLVFAGGSLMAALADSLTGLLLGRALQGAGAVSAAVTALLADIDSERKPLVASVFDGLDFPLSDRHALTEAFGDFGLGRRGASRARFDEHVAYDFLEALGGKAETRVRHGRLASQRGLS